MIGTKLYKNNKEDMAKYTDTAIWCNSTNAHIEDKGSFYEVCENVVPEPTTEEKLAELDAQYNADFTQLMLALDKARIYDNAELEAEIKADIVALDKQYDADYEAIEGGE